MQRDHLLEENGFRKRHMFDRLAGHGIGKEADKIAGVSGLEDDADFAVGLESADAGAVPGARIDDHERPSFEIDNAAGRWNHPDQAIIDRVFERPSVYDQLGLVIQYMRYRFGQVFAILIAAL